MKARLRSTAAVLLVSTALNANVSGTQQTFVEFNGTSSVIHLRVGESSTVTVRSKSTRQKNSSDIPLEALCESQLLKMLWFS